MASMGQQFRDGFAAQQAPDSEGPADLKGPADEQDAGGDMTCPMCGASALKIVQAAQQGGGSGAPPMGGGGPMMK